ncbi:hypothetical protein COCVIDRAFT_86340, partial [Bipolaris victoriae FI3]
LCEALSSAPRDRQSKLGFREAWVTHGFRLQPAKSIHAHANEETHTYQAQCKIADFSMEEREPMAAAQ